MTIFFGDIVGFNCLTADCNATEVWRATYKTEVVRSDIFSFKLIEVLNTFYGALDSRLKKFRVYQVQKMMRMML